MKSVILGGYRHTVESPRKHNLEAELWMQSNSIRSWDFSLHDWSRWFDVHDVEFQPGYAGIRMLRPDILEWYGRQGRERPIYMTQTHPGIIGSVPYPLAAMKAAFPKSVGRYGCQLDYMMALALSEGFERIIFYGCGQPYVSEPNSPAARKWWARHGSMLWWMGLAEARGVELLYDGPCINRPFDGDYGYDMTGLGGERNGVDVER